jgi:hypothetical protein
VGESPRDAVESTLALLAKELEGTGFALKPGLMLVRKQSDLTHRLRTQTNRYNRAGLMARFEFSAWLESDRLGKWMKEHAPGRPAAVTKFDRLVIARQLKLPGRPHHAEWDVVDPASRPAAAAEVAAIVRDDILPWFAKVDDPAGALDELGGASSHPSIIRYAVATRHADLARARIAEFAREVPKFRETLDRLRRDGKPSAFRGSYESLAWVAIDAGVA